MRSLLRWTSLVLTAAIFYAFGVAAFHHRRFNIFLGTLLALSVAIVAVFLATRSDGPGPPDHVPPPPGPVVE